MVALSKQVVTQAGSGKEKREVSMGDEYCSRYAVAVLPKNL